MPKSFTLPNPTPSSSPIGLPLVYSALLTQTSTNAPVATILHNTLGGTPVWARNSAGTYTLTLTGVWTADKTLIIAASAYDPVTGFTIPFAYNAGASSVNVLAFKVVNPDTGLGADSVLTNTSITILVYP